MEKKTVKKLKLRKDVKISIVFLILVYLQFTAIIKGMELNNDMMILGSISLIDMMIAILLVMSK